MVRDRPTDRQTDRPTLLPIELLSQLKINMSHQESMIHPSIWRRLDTLPMKIMPLQVHDYYPAHSVTKLRQGKLISDHQAVKTLNIGRVDHLFLHILDNWKGQKLETMNHR